jgi:hypothetical protein
MKNPHTCFKGYARRIGARAPLSLWVVLLVFLSACGTVTHSKISGSLKNLSRNQTVAILPVEVSDPDQKDAATLFHRSLYANLVQGKFHVQERYVVDSLLLQAGLTDPAQYRKVNISRLGEILGADAVVFGKVDKVERAYLLIHSSINVGVSAEMVDTRTGESLWIAEDNASDFSGLAKIPTGMLAAFSAPIYFITNKINLRKLTMEMTAKLTTLVKQPGGSDIKPIPTANKDKAPATAVVQKQTPNKVVLVAHTPTQKVALVPALARARIAPRKTALPLYTLQVGAFQTKANADKMMRNLAGKGYNTSLALLEKGNSTWYKVQVERFQDVEEAMTFARGLTQREHLHAILIPIDAH